MIIAENRLHKPDLMKEAPETAQDNLKHCPFEYGNESLSGSEIFAIRDKGGPRNGTGWKTRVVPNLYNALSIEAEKTNRRIGFFEHRDGLGAHEVIIETPNHYARMDQYSQEDFENYIRTITARIGDLEKDMRLEYIQVFKNSGKYAGASMPHPHSQILATPFIPKEIKERLVIQKNYFEKHGRSLVGDMVDEEIRLNERIVYENATFVVFTPYASCFPFEVLIAPKTGLSKMSKLTQHQVGDLGKAMQFAFKRLYRELGDFPFNMLFFNMPPMSAQNDPDFFYKMDDYYRFHINITPRIYHLAGFEISTGMHINPVPPELAALRLREES